MELDIEVIKAMHGTTPETVTVRVGAENLRHFNPFPSTNEKDEVFWGTVGNHPGKPLVTGQLIGMGLHYLGEHNVWSLKGEPMFGLARLENGEEVVWFQRSDAECYEPATEDFNGLTVETMAKAVADCSEEWSTQANQRRALMSNIWGPVGCAPDCYMAAQCVVGDVNPPGCSSDPECPSGSLCVDGVCKP